LVVYGSAAVDQPNFQRFGNVAFTGDELAPGYAEVEILADADDSDDFQGHDVDTITGF
jgi:hypothetical protein